jgi:hypothetical protein
MRQCFAKAEKQVVDTVKKRDEAVGQYKANLTKNEEDLKKLYAMVEQITSVDGLNIAATLKQGLVLPTENLKFHIDQDDVKYVSGLASMEIKDPDQFFDLMKKNLLSLKAQIAKQNRAVMNGDNQSGLANQDSVAQRGVYGHIRNIKENIEKVLSEVAEYKQMCEGAFQAFVQGQRAQRAEAIAQQNARQSEQAEYCNRYNAIASSPICPNATEFDDLIAASAKLGDSNARLSLGAFKQHCQNIGADGNQDVMTSNKFKKKFKKSPEDFCADKKSRACATLLREIAIANKSDETDPVKRASTLELIAKAEEAVILHHGDEALEDDDSNIFAENSQLGENRSALCSSYNNSGNPITKALMETAGTVGQALGAGMGQ